MDGCERNLEKSKAANGNFPNAQGRVGWAELRCHVIRMKMKHSPFLSVCAAPGSLGCHVY